MEEFQRNLKEAMKHMQIADHMTYVTFPLVNEYKLLLKIFGEIYLSIIYSVSAILNYEHLHKRIVMYSDYKDNLDTFVRVGKSYSLSNEQINRIKEIIDLNKKHNESAMEFVRKNKVVIMSDSLGTRILDLRLIKEYLLLAKELMLKVSGRVKGG